jgi:hypothetical protein
VFSKKQIKSLLGKTYIVNWTWRTQMKSAKFLVVACAAITVMTTTSGFAQVKNFEGPSVYASTGYESWSVEPSNLSGSSLVTWDAFKPSAIPLNIGFDYT